MEDEASSRAGDASTPSSAAAAGGKLGRRGLIDRTEFVRVIIQCLYSLGYRNAAAALESESGVPLDSPEFASLLPQVISGRWEDCVDVIGRFEHVPEEARTMAAFLVWSESFLELLSGGEGGMLSSALDVLRRRISPLGVERHLVHRLARRLVTLEGKAAEDVVRQRVGLLVGLAELLPPWFRLPGGRLEQLVEMALLEQRASCIYHNSPDPISLYEDHRCSPDQIPSRTAQILSGHKNEVWFVQFSNNGEYLASSSKDCTAIIWKLMGWWGDVRFVNLWGTVKGCMGNKKTHGLWWRTRVMWQPLSMVEVRKSAGMTKREMERKYCMVDLGGDVRTVAEGDEGAVTTGVVIDDGAWWPNGEGQRTAMARLWWIGGTAVISPSQAGKGVAPLGQWRRRSGALHSLVGDIGASHPTHLGHRNPFAWEPFTGNSQSRATFNISFSLPSKAQVDSFYRVEEHDAVSLKHILEGHSKPISFVAWSPDDTMLITCGNGEVLKLWDVQTGLCIRTLGDSVERIISSCAWFPDSKQLVCGSCDPENCIYICNLQGKELKVWKGQSLPRVSSLAVTPDGEHLISVLDEKMVRIYDYQKGTELVISEEHPITSLSLSKDGRFLILNLKNEEIHLWNVDGKTSKPSTYRGHQQMKYVIRSCFGGPDCSFIASGSEDSQVYIWHRERCMVIKVLSGHEMTVNCVSWNPTKPYMLASASDDRTVRIWLPALVPKKLYI
ncbi:hypothetical protein Taro_013773 [Colocasia esculenta]|uniref:WD repeat-containing protein 26 n=1 Tax=Colocasia esculenta TaxID=4460 RepID=A0A843UH39_COLES|nr:hypothetical protein [Colocasia esculenta]